jgi:transmembrane sensor
MNRSQDIEAKAAEWLIRREQPQWSQADQAALDGWLNESMSHKAGFWRLEHAWQMADRIGALSARDITPRPRRTRLPLKWWQAGTILPVHGGLSLLITRVERQPHDAGCRQ